MYSLAPFVLVQHEHEGEKLVEERRLRPSGGNFQGIGVYRFEREPLCGGCTSIKLNRKVLETFQLSDSRRARKGRKP